jgi:hypothetical protein
MYKCECIVKYDQAVANGEAAPISFVEGQEDIHGNLARCIKDCVEILKAGGEARRKHLTKVVPRARLGRFHEVEKNSHVMFLQIEKARSESHRALVVYQMQ